MFAGLSEGSIVDFATEWAPTGIVEWYKENMCNFEQWWSEVEHGNRKFASCEYLIAFSILENMCLMFNRHSQRIGKVIHEHSLKSTIAWPLRRMNFIGYLQGTLDAWFDKD